VFQNKRNSQALPYPCRTISPPVGKNSQKKVYQLLRTQNPAAQRCFAYERLTYGIKRTRPSSRFMAISECEQEALSDKEKGPLFWPMEALCRCFRKESRTVLGQIAERAYNCKNRCLPDIRCVEAADKPGGCRRSLWLTLLR
jgi:hypothetical protein